MPGPRRILVVDDEKNVRLTLSGALADTAPVDVAASGAQALDLLGKADYGLVLLDLSMPEMDGMAVLGEVRRRRPDVPVVMMSAHGTVDVVVRAMRAGAIGFLQKPFSAEDVRSVASGALAAPPSRAARAVAESGDYDDRIARAREAVPAGLLDAATEHACGALVLDPTRPEAFTVLGVVHQLRGDIAEASRHFSAAAALRPGYGPAVRNLENLAAAGGRRNVGRYDLG